ncbi:hypothetical protein ACLOJK_006853 [Asimina triloba]
MRWVSPPIGEGCCWRSDQSGSLLIRWSISKSECTALMVRAGLREDDGWCVPITELIGMGSRSSLDGRNRAGRFGHLPMMVVHGRSDGGAHADFLDLPWFG